MTPAEDRRRRQAYAMRSVASLDTATQLLAIYEQSEQTVLDEVAQLPNWRYETLLAWAIDRRPAPTGPTGELSAQDLLLARMRTLAGLLAEATEQAFADGHLRIAKALARLSNEAVQHLIGAPAMRLVGGYASSADPGGSS